MFKPPDTNRLSEVDQADCTYAHHAVEIEGVVSPGGQGGWPHSDEFAVHCFKLEAWRRVNSPVIKRPLTILRPVDPDGEWFEEFPELSIQRFHVLLSKDELRAIFAAASDQPAKPLGLDEIVSEMNRPVVIATQRFGDLVLDRRIDWFEGQSTWNGEPVRITFASNESHDISSGLAVAEQLWCDHVGWTERVAHFAVEKLLPLKNECWLDEGEEPMDATEFRTRMSLESVAFDEDGGFTFCHDDGDLFWGHSIQIGGTLSEGLNVADIAG